MYSEKVIEHFSNPHNVGELEGANAVGEVGNARCGDIMRMYLKIEDDVIKDATFKTFGCCAAIASSSVTTDLIKGMTVEEALNFKNATVVEALDGLPPAKIHCSVLAEEAIKKAIENYREQKLEQAQ
jgi:nitrogen fixation NifU-like protein